MKKKNGFIAISVIYSFFLCFVMLMMGMLGNYLNSRLMLSKINEPPIFEQDNKLVTKILKDNTIKMPGQDGVPFIDYSIGIPLSDSSSALESGLFGNAEDDDGISYYFRGSINNNYVKFADKFWRIVRINTDIKPVINNLFSIIIYLKYLNAFLIVLAIL